MTCPPEGMALGSSFIYWSISGAPDLALGQ